MQKSIRMERRYFKKYTCGYNIFKPNFHETKCSDVYKTNFNNSPRIFSDLRAFFDQQFITPKIIQSDYLVQI